jgi:hypothetical protein
MCFDVCDIDALRHRPVRHELLKARAKLVDIAIEADCEQS